MSITQTCNGLLYKEDFNYKNLLWTLTPSNSDIEFIKSTGVKLVTTNNRQEYMLPAPNSDGYVIQADIDCNIDSGGIFNNAGVLIQSTTNECIECQLYKDIVSVGDDTKYTKIKVELCQEVYTFFAFNGYEWVEIGNSRLSDANRVGFYVTASGGLHTELTVSKFCISKSNSLVINNIKNNYIIKLLDNKDKEIEIKHVIKNGKAIIDMAFVDLPFQGKLKVLSHNNELIEQIEGTFCGGDEYDINCNVKFFINEQEVSSSSAFDLGKLGGVQNTYKLTIANVGNSKIINRDIEILPFSRYFYENVTLAHSEDGEFKKVLNIDTINPCSAVTVVMKITREQQYSSYNYDNTCKFVIRVT